jgi:membrane-bound metal-dependent hydrolase YbcI (DUF457 family)
MFAVGHLALGYLIGKASSKTLNIKADISLLFLFSVLPDIDLIIPFLKHRGPTHSLIPLAIASVLSLLLIGRKTIPYAIAYLQHIVPGDYITGGGVQLLWPISRKWYELELPLGESTGIALELAAFAAFIVLMWKTRDLANLLQPQPKNYILLIPLITLSLPLLAGFPLPVPSILVPAHIACMTLLTIPLIANLRNR